MHSVEIDLYSDTATLPTSEMRAFMCAAEVGDEQKGEDPSVNELQDMTAELLGKEAALFLPSGTMCNQIAFAVHCRQGDIILLDRSAHPLHSEGGGASVLAGATTYPLDGEKGQYTPAQVAEAMEPADRYWPGVSLVSVEQTTNRPGGYIWPLDQMREVCEVAHGHGAKTHMDGARLLNASVATGIPAAAYAETFDSVWIDLSKGLGAPVGAVIASSAEFVEAAWLWKQRIGGSMRQAGIIAAAGIYALKHNVERLADDHRHAKRLASGIAGAPGLSVEPEEVETNMVWVDVSGTGLSAADFADRLVEASGVRVSAPSPNRIRAIPHVNITEADVDRAVEAFRGLAGALAQGATG